MSIRASCPQCPRSYKVPHADKEWRCKECDAVLQVESPEPAPELDGTECGSCGALSFGDAAYCEECGEPLDGDIQGRPRLTRKEAAGEMRTSMRRIGRLKTIIGLHLVLVVIATVIVSLALSRMAHELPKNQVFLLTLIQLTFLGLSYAAYRLVDRKPFAVVTSLAGFQTLKVIWSYLDGSPWIPSLIWAGTLWSLVAEAAHVTRLAKEHPDLYAAKRMRGEHLTHARGGKRASVRKRVAGRGSAGTNWWLLGGVLLAAGGMLVMTMRAVGKEAPRPRVNESAFVAPAVPLETAAEEFRRAWNARDIERLGAMTKSSLRDKMKVTLGKLSERYGWGDHFPQLEAAAVTEPSTSIARVWFPSEAGEFPVRFSVEDGAWVVRSVKTSPLKDWRPGVGDAGAGEE